MSVTRVVAVTCDGCGWTETGEAERSVLDRPARRPGRWRGWWSVVDEASVARFHLCPLCVQCPAVAEPVLEEHPVMEGPDIP